MNALTILSAIGFPLLTLIFFYYLLREIWKAIALTAWPEQKKISYQNRVLYLLLIWAVVVSVLALSGLTQRFDLFPVNVMPMLMIPLVTVLIILFSKNMKDVLQQMELKALTQLQVFRFFVEIVLWLLFLEGNLPEQMTFEGRNFDIVAGLTSLAAARYFLQSKGWMIAWNIFGMVLLINIVTIAILSMPTPLRVFMNEPANTIVAKFPYVFLPTFLVPLAYTLHFFSLRKLLMK